MKRINHLFSILMALAFLVTTISCGDDDEGGGPQADPLLGTYSISSASLSDDLVVPGTSDVLLDAGTVITQQINAAFLLEAGCNNLLNARIDLRENGVLFYTCLTEGSEFQNGTWSINGARSQLNLTVNIQGNPVPLIFANFNEASLTGLVNNVPLTPAIIMAIDPNIQGLTLPVYPANIILKLAKD